jgi:hypothetical protein
VHVGEALAYNRLRVHGNIVSEKKKKLSMKRGKGKGRRSGQEGVRVSRGKTVTYSARDECAWDDSALSRHDTWVSYDAGEHTETFLRECSLYRKGEGGNFVRKSGGKRIRTKDTHQVRQLLQNLVPGNLVQHGPRFAQFCFEPLAHLWVLQDVIWCDHERDGCGIGARTEENASLV